MRYYVAWVFIIALAGCHPKDTDTPQPEPVPANLLATNKVDSVITLTEKVDFSTVSETGQGPTGTLIRWDNLGFPLGSFQANTYDQQSRLVGTVATSYGYHVIGKYDYQGSFLAQNFTGLRFDLPQPLSTVQPNGLAKYQYNKDGQLARILVYGRVSDTNTFKLTEATTYEYSSTGQLQLTRTTFPTGAIGPTSFVDYWENGDRIHEEIYYPATSSRPAPAVSKYTYLYNQQANPYALIVNQVSAHAMTSIKKYVSSGGALMQQEPTTEIEYDNQLDAQGRIVLLKSRSSIGSSPGHWTDWSGPVKFTYAP